MKYTNFEELPVWKAAIEFALKLVELTNQADFRGFGDTKNQLERGAVSISNNIAEGFERGANKELIYFLPKAPLVSVGRCCVYANHHRVSQISNLRFQI